MPRVMKESTARVISFVRPYLTGEKQGPLPCYKTIWLLCGCEEGEKVYDLLRVHLHREEFNRLQEEIGIERSPYEKKSERFSNGDRLLEFLKYLINCAENPFPEYEEVVKRYKALGGEATVHAVRYATTRLEGDYKERFDLLHGIRIKPESDLHKKAARFIMRTANECRCSLDKFPTWRQIAESFVKELKSETGKLYRISARQIKWVYNSLSDEEKCVVKQLR